MTKTIALANHKGGVGKTTSVLNIGYILAEKGFKVLLVDAGPQGNLSTSFNIEMTKKENTIYNLLHKEKIVPFTINENLDIIPSSFDLSVWEEETQPAKEMRLKLGLKNIGRNYDFIIIDSPPSLGKLTQSVLTASDFVLVPMESEQYCVDGMVRFFDLIEQIKEYLNADLNILGIFITFFEVNTNLHNIIKNRIKDYYGDRLLPVEIRKNITIPESIFAKEELSVVHPKSNGSKDYQLLVNTILNLI